MQWIDKRPAWRVVLEFALLLAVLLWPWPGVDRLFARAFCAVCNALGAQRALGVGYLVHLRPAIEKDLPAAAGRVLWHALLCVRNPTTGLETRLGFNTRSTTYVPLAALGAFVIAVRLWRRPRSGRAAILGVCSTFTFSALSLLTSALRFLALPRVQGLRLGGSSAAFLDAVFLAFVVPPAMAYAVPLLTGCLMLWLTDGAAPGGSAVTGHPRSSRAPVLNTWRE
jgi:hypothetical protein